MYKFFFLIYFLNSFSFYPNVSIIYPIVEIVYPKDPQIIIATNITNILSIEVYGTISP